MQFKEYSKNVLFFLGTISKYVCCFVLLYFSVYAVLICFLMYIEFADYGG